MGKGSRQRGRQVCRAQFDKNWEMLELARKNERDTRDPIQKCHDAIQAAKVPQEGRVFWIIQKEGETVAEAAARLNLEKRYPEETSNGV